MISAPITREQIAAIWQAYDLGALQTITVPRRGCSNACFLVNEDRVARFQITERPYHKFRTEKIAYDLLRGSDIPVPEVLVLDESRTLAPCAFLITTRLPGESAYESWDGLDQRAREQLAFEAGCYLARLHRHTLPAFGGLSACLESPRIKIRGCTYETATRFAGTGRGFPTYQPGFPTPGRLSGQAPSQMSGDGFRTWMAYLEDYVARNARQARDEALLDAPTTARIEQLLARFQPLMATVTTGCLVHRDYHFENILQQEGKVTGIIDFEWAMSGDPAFDCRLDDTLEECPGSVEPFYAGYASISPFGEHHRPKVEFYRLLLCLECIAGWGRDPEAADWMPGEYRRLPELLPKLEREV